MPLYLELSGIILRIAARCPPHYFRLAFPLWDILRKTEMIIFHHDSFVAEQGTCSTLAIQRFRSDRDRIPHSSLQRFEILSRSMSALFMSVWLYSRTRGCLVENRSASC